MPRVAIVTLGCPKNSVDSEALAGLVSAGGHDIVASPDGAEVVLVNTCGFIDAARRETIDEALELAELKETSGLKGLVLTGCLVARAADELEEALPEVDAFVDFAAYGRVAQIVDGVATGTLTERVHGDPGTRFDPAYWDAVVAASPRLRFGRAPWSYLKIAEGCDRGCTFCAIPLMRGKLRSRPLTAIVAEARMLAAQGVSEISLVSQDSVMWGRDVGDGDFVSLLRALEDVEGLRRLRLMYLHPQGVTPELVDAMLESPLVVPYFDLSLQHVSPRVLRAMGRWGDPDRFHALVTSVRERAPLAAIRSTFISGFPGEDDDDAELVEEFVATHDLDWIGVFTYSREEGTRSHDLEDQVPAVVARERTESLARTADLAMARRAESLVGAELDVLVERFDRATASWVGRSHREAPEIDGEISLLDTPSVAVGDYVVAVVTGHDGADLTARVL